MTGETNSYTADELDAIWLTFQVQGTALCPRCGAVLKHELAEDLADTGEGSDAPTIMVSCTGCGRRGTNDPEERSPSEPDSV